MQTSAKVAVIIPCYNEEPTIGKVVTDFRKALPTATVYVCNNNSTDRSAEIAAAAGAVILTENNPGYGSAIRRLYTDVDADVYVLTDADGTYDAASAPKLIAHLLEQQLDMVSAQRIPAEENVHRPGHEWGNKMLSGLVALIFGQKFQDMLSGYKIMSRRYVKSFPALNHGMEFMTEMILHALSLRLPVAEIPTPFFARPEGSFSKLHTFRDGFRILITILRTLLNEMPFRTSLVTALIFLFASLACGIPVINEYLTSGTITRVPTAILAAALAIISTQCLLVGLVMHGVSHGRFELRRLHYLAQPPLPRQ